MALLTPASNYNHTLTPSPPISKLYNDILGYIFDLNAEMGPMKEKTPAVLTLQYTSQVCSRWRDLALKLPSLWAQVLNVNFLAQKGEEWRNEVVRRTGSAPLHIKSFGRLTASEFSTVEEYLGRILEESWNRIHTLDILFAHNSLLSVPGRWSSIFGRPAPSLRSFKFAWRQLPEELSSPNFVLFSNQAPSLRKLFVTPMNVNLTTLSVPNLRWLESHKPITTSDLLRGLGQTPLLQKLSLSAPGEGPVIHGEIPRSLPQVSLPHLTDIDIAECDGGDSLFFLQHIIPSHGCRLSYFGWYASASTNPININLFRDVLSTYSTYCTELGSATDLEICLTQDTFHLDVSLPMLRCFLFSIENNIMKLPEHTVPTLIPSLANLRLDKITKLELYILLDENVFLNPAVTKFMLGFVSVELLLTNGRALRVLTLIQSITETVTLPALTTIQLNPRYDEPEQLTQAVDFIDARIKLGVPIDTLTVKTNFTDSFSKFIPALTLKPLM